MSNKSLLFLSSYPFYVFILYILYDRGVSDEPANLLPGFFRFNRSAV